MKHLWYQANTLLPRQFSFLSRSYYCAQNPILTKSRTAPLICGAVLLFTAYLQPPTLFAQEDDLESANCLECHELIDIDGAEHSLDSILIQSIHEDNECVDCHTDITELEHPEKLQKVDCGVCHDDVVDEYKEHGRELISNGGDLPQCVDCHGDHNIRSHSDVEALTHPRNLSRTCATCHEDNRIRERHSILKDAEIIQRYQGSVHAKAIEDADESGATCINCHSNAGSAHSIIYTRDPRSSLSHFNNPNTCGQCHEEIAKEFWRGIHGQLVAEGATDAPVCTDCHGEHSIISPQDPNSTVSRERLAEATCSPCHASARLNEKYGVTGSVLSRIDGYHGTKSAAGDATVANCASCHQAHLILPHTDTLSSIHPANLQHTCGECHLDITLEVAATPIHAEPAVGQSELSAIIEKIYIILIIVVILAMLLHWAIDLRRHFRSAMRKPQVRRMTTNEVWQHAALMITFILLVITGFSLRHATAWWVQGLFAWPGGFELRGLVHRIAAVVFTITTLWHLVYLFTARGRQFFFDMLPTMNDARELKQMLRYNLGKTSTHPRFGRFTYVEKIEYWALAWGTAVMILTGLLLWFENSLISWMTLDIFNIALVIHYYEAWLATLAIIVWHLYSTIFSPVVYPMNPAWLTGTMPVDVYQHEHSGDIETLNQESRENETPE